VAARDRRGRNRCVCQCRTRRAVSAPKRAFDLRQAQPSLIKEKARLLLREYERTELDCLELRIRSAPPTRSGAL
jgi:hypothetical protein